MRKSLVLLLLSLILFLTACHQGVLDPTSDPIGTLSTPPSSTTQTLPMRELYVPGSALEQHTQGAVRCYETDAGTHRLLSSFGNGLLLVTTQGSSVLLTQITGDKGYVKRQVQLFCDPELFISTLCVSSDTLGYYDENNGCVIFLNGQLQEIRRVVLPSDRIGAPIISSDLHLIYFVTKSQIRVLDAQSDVSRLLREHNYPTLVLKKVCFNNEQLLCYIAEEDADAYTAFISTKNGAIIATDAQMLSFAGKDNCYFLSRTEGSVCEYLFGEYGHPVNEFAPKQDGNCFWLPETDKAMVVNAAAENSVMLDAYDLTNGLRTASILLTDAQQCYSFTPDTDASIIWFLMQDVENGHGYLCRWDMTCNSVVDSDKYTLLHYTAENPDADGLSECMVSAKSLKEQYSVNLSFCNTNIEIPEEYTFVAEHKVRAIENGIAVLEDVLSQFPDGFLTRLAQSTADDTIHIQLVRSISDQPISLQSWQNGNSYITLEIGDTMKQNFYHGLFYMLESYLFANSGYLDRWSTCNPKGFDYMYHYTGYESLHDSPYLKDAERAFVNAYSMTYPKEDRAVIFEYAMTEGNEALFATKTIQNKLSLLCTAIRDAFDLKQGTNFLWEQYLK